MILADMTQEKSGNIVFLRFIRHGQKFTFPGQPAATDAPHTNHGQYQIATAAHMFLSKTEVHRLMSSELDRAAEAAAIAHMFTVNGSPYEPERLIELGFSDIEVEGYAQGMNISKQHIIRGEVPTLQHWWNAVPDYMTACKEKYQIQIINVAIQLSTKFGNGAMALIGNHAPVCQAAMEDLSIPILGEAGIIEYRVGVDATGMASILDSRMIFPGF